MADNMVDNMDIIRIYSIGFFQDPISWRYGNVPYVWPYVVAIFFEIWA